MKKVLSFVLLLSILFSISVCVAKAEGTSGQSDDDPTFAAYFTSEYKTVAKTDKLTMIADNNGSFVIKNNKTGHLWYSHPEDIASDRKTLGVNKRNFQSEVVVYYVYKDDKGETSSYAQASVNSQSLIANNYIRSEAVSGGIKVVYDFYPISARVTVVYTIKDDTLTAKIVGKETIERESFRKAVKKTLTKEQKSIMQDSYITSIWLLPTFGAGNSSQNGFVFVPDGCGAYMDYRPAGHNTEISNIPVYGNELSIDEFGVIRDKSDAIVREKKANLPVFAVSNGNDGVLGFIAKGAENSSINAFKSGHSNSYTGVSAQLDLRKITYAMIGTRCVQGLAKSAKSVPDFEVRYYIISDDDLTISKFAEVLRGRWEKEGYLKKHKTDPSLSLQIIGAVDVDSNFLGFPVKKIKPLTTISQTKSIVEQLKKQAKVKVAVNYIGWQENGVQNAKVIKTAKPIGSLGNKKDISTLRKVCSALYLDADLITFKKSGNGISVNSDGAKTAFDKPVVVREFSYSKYEYLKTGYNLLTPLKIFEVYKSYKKSFDDLKKNIGISFNKMSSSCYSDFGKKSSSRAQTVGQYKKVFSSAKRSMSAESANFYALPYVERIYNAPANSSRQKIYDGEVPFYQILLHGYIAMTSPYLDQVSNLQSGFLRAVETGSELSYLLMYEDSGAVNGTDYDYYYGTTYGMHNKDIVKYCKKYSALQKKISDKTVKDYIRHNANVTETVYENGIRVFVNYGNTDFSLEGITAKAKSFCYREEE